MNPNHLTPEVRKQVTQAEKSRRLFQKEKREAGISNLWNTEQEYKDWINPFYEPVANILQLEEFSELLLLEVKYGLVSDYLGGVTLNPDGDTVIRIG